MRYTFVVMNILTRLLLIFSWVLLVTGQSKPPGPSQLDTLFDAFLEGVIEAKGDQIDPLALEDKFLQVEKPVKLNLNLTSAKVFGLKGLKRDEPLVYTVDPSKGAKYIRVSVKVLQMIVAINLNVTMKIFYSHLPLLSSKLNVTIGSFAAAIEIETSKINKKITVKSFTVTDFRDIEVNFLRKVFFYGPERKAWLLNRVSKEVIKFYKKKLLEVSERTIEMKIQDKINSLPERVKKLLYE